MTKWIALTGLRRGPRDDDSGLCPGANGDVRRGRAQHLHVGAGGEHDRAGGSSAEDDADVMCLPIIDEPDAEITGQGNAFDLD
jgi:hypothetical protein